MLRPPALEAPPAERWLPACLAAAGSAPARLRAQVGTACWGALRCLLHSCAYSPELASPTPIPGTLGCNGSHLLASPRPPWRRWAVSPPPFSWPWLCLPSLLASPGIGAGGAASFWVPPAGGADAALPHLGARRGGLDPVRHVGPGFTDTGAEKEEDSDVFLRRTGVRVTRGVDGADWPPLGPWPLCFLRLSCTNRSGNTPPVLGKHGCRGLPPLVLSAPLPGAYLTPSLMILTLPTLVSPRMSRAFWTHWVCGRPGGIPTVVTTAWWPPGGNTDPVW